MLYCCWRWHDQSLEHNDILQLELSFFLNIATSIQNGIKYSLIKDIYYGTVYFKRTYGVFVLVSVKPSVYNTTKQILEQRVQCSRYN